MLLRTEPLPAAASSAAALKASQITQLVDQISTIIVGKREQVTLSVICLLASGHLLIEDIPGVGKTTIVCNLAAIAAARWTSATTMMKTNTAWTSWACARGRSSTTITTLATSGTGKASGTGTTVPPNLPPTQPACDPVPQARIAHVGAVANRFLSARSRAGTGPGS